MKLRLAFILVSLLGCVVGSPTFNNMVVHDSRTAPPPGFVSQGAAPAGEMLTLRLAMTPNNIAGLEEALYAVSTPSSALYGQHLTKEEVEAFVAPTPETVTTVNSWLNANGITPQVISDAGDWISFTISVSKANTLLNAKFETFTHASANLEAVRTLSYSLPAEVLPHVDALHPSTSFPQPGSNLPVFSSPGERKREVKEKRQTVPASCGTTVTPTCLQDLYGIPTTKATQTSNTIGVSGFIDQFAQSADLATFLKAQRPDLVGTTFSLATLDGGTNPQGARDAGIEANLDIQYTVGVASGVPTTFISVGDQFQDGALDGFLDIINFLLAESNPPHVLTTSYGQNENTISRSLANNLCNAYMQLGARGTSILFASGDGGVAGSQTSRCTTFLPTFPSGCPFMTSVGATTGITETAATFSSGGFSNYFARPSYQSAAVTTYLTALGTTNSGLFNTSGRGFPDVSAQGENVEIVSGGQTGTVAGTSCASPIFTSVIALINDRLVAEGKAPLGFLNPFLYSTGLAGLKDITTGDNPGCGTNGFPARAGWDPVTGLGTPNFAKLLAAAGG